MPSVLVLPVPGIGNKGVMGQFMERSVSQSFVGQFISIVNSVLSVISSFLYYFSLSRQLIAISGIQYFPPTVINITNCHLSLCSPHYLESFTLHRQRRTSSSSSFRHSTNK